MTRDQIVSLKNPAHLQVGLIQEVFKHFFINLFTPPLFSIESGTGEVRSFFKKTLPICLPAKFFYFNEYISPQDELFLPASHPWKHKIFTYSS